MCPASLAGTGTPDQPASYPAACVSRIFWQTIAAVAPGDEFCAWIWGRALAAATSLHTRLAGTAIVRKANRAPIAVKRKVSFLAFMVISPFFETAGVPPPEMTEIFAFRRRGRNAYATNC